MIEPKTVATTALAVRRSNHAARSLSLSARSKVLMTNAIAIQIVTTYFRLIRTVVYFAT